MTLVFQPPRPVSGAARTLLHVVQDWAPDGLPGQVLDAMERLAPGNRAAMRRLVHANQVLPCYRHGGTECGPPELVYHATQSPRG